MPIVWMSLAVISFGFFANFIVESTKYGGNTQLYIPAWLCLGVGLMFATLAYFEQKKIDYKRECIEQAREKRAIELHKALMVEKNWTKYYQNNENNKSKKQ